MLFGGFIGGLLFSPIMLLMDIDDHNMSISHLNIQYIVENILPWFALFSMTGILWGLIPALITSTFLVRKRVYLTNFRAYLDLFLLGCSVTFCCFVWLWLIVQNWRATLSLLQLVLSGGLSSVIIGHFVIPRQNKQLP